jgi:hypothetical protein
MLHVHREDHHSKEGDLHHVPENPQLGLPFRTTFHALAYHHGRLGQERQPYQRNGKKRDGWEYVQPFSPPSFKLIFELRLKRHIPIPLLRNKTINKSKSPASSKEARASRIIANQCQYVIVLLIVSAMSPRHIVLRQGQETASHTDHDHQEDSQKGTGIVNEDSGCCSR